MQDTKHFQDMLKERNIDPAWVDAAMREPDSVEHQPDGTRHYLKQISEYGNRWLRIIVNPNKIPPAKITLFRSPTWEIKTMKIKMDKETDTLYFRLDEGRIVESEEIKPGVILDYDESDRVVGVEFLQVSTRASKDELASLDFKTA